MTTIETLQDITVDNEYVNYYDVDGNIKQTNIYPITIINKNAVGITVSFIEAITYTSSLNYFIVGSECITFDGLTDSEDNPLNPITLNGITDWVGLIQNGSFDKNSNNYISGYSNICVKNIKITCDTSSSPVYLLNSAGWICQSYFGNGYYVKNNIIQNCCSTINIHTENENEDSCCGGISGAYTGANNFFDQTYEVNEVNVTIQNCYTTGNILNKDSGGICGAFTGNSSGNVIITNCHSDGEIRGYNSGGICGSFTGNYNGNVNISNCYSKGEINGEKSGGICGSNVGDNYDTTFKFSSVTIEICHSEGAINGVSSGGICGSATGTRNGRVTINSCYSEGAINGEKSGGICGDSTSYISADGTVNISKCYSIGIINGNYSGGITGAYTGLSADSEYGIVNIDNCYSIGNIQGPFCGGICGKETAGSGGNITISNCYSQGAISYTDTSTSYGISDYYQLDSSGKLLINNCYCLNGEITNDSTKFTNSYQANGIWVDKDANANLKPGTTPPTNPGPGTIWTSTEVETPYVLTNNSEPVILTTSKNEYFTPSFSKGFNYSLVSINNKNSSNFQFSINKNNGVVDCKNLDFSPITKYIIKIFQTKNKRGKYYDYKIITINLSHIKHQKANICFIENTPIKTDQGLIPIQKINPLKHTIHSKKIVAITKTLSTDNYLVCFEKDSLSKNIPSEKTIMSKEHKVFYNGKFMEADEFIEKFENVKKIDYNEEFLYNVLMETHEKMNVNNMICETLHPNNFFAKLYNNNLHPELKNKLFHKMRESLKNGDIESYKKTATVFRKSCLLKDAINNNIVRVEPVKSSNKNSIKNMKL